MNTAAFELQQAQLFVDGSWQDGEEVTVGVDKYLGTPLSEVHVASCNQVERALRGVADAQQRIALTPYERYQMLSRAAVLLAERREQFITHVVDDSGFTIGDAANEVARAIQTLELSAEEAKRIHGEVVPFSSSPSGGDRIAFTVRRPRGVVCAITPFNSPLNTVLHKVAPALAAGNGVVLKPSTYTPLTAGALVALLLDAGVPPELLALVQGPGSTVGQWLLESPVPAFYAFTGSTEVGEHLRACVGLRPTQLELGSLSSTIICADADLAKSATACVNASFRKAGQVCTSVQRIYVQDDVIEEFTDRMVTELSGRAWGDPRQPDCFVGPVISERDARRIESWVDAAVAGGATVRHGGARDRSCVQPTILTGVPHDADVLNREVFGPVVSIVGFREVDEAIRGANDTPFGLAAGIFTRDVTVGLEAARRLRMGSVHVNQTSSNRVDLMPYGGVKKSGMGLEGPRYAIEEMTELQLVTIGD